ncbi:hypothetical protein VNO77_27800 [Canavalia gladiata]|uniref:Peptidase A1 domain-containing protein n=1 Tax=Canavalia gladiata TaxID=3824 RepID=A0AAN9KVC5_CANGL
MDAALLNIITVFALSLLLSSYEAKPVKSFSVDLIHRDSPLSPFYNASLNRTEHLRNAAMRSISRIKTINYSTANGNKAETVIIPDQGAYLMKIFVGTPPKESLVVADTGSDLTWVQCQPCDKCYPQKDPIFNPSKSSSYKAVSCYSDECSLMPISSCGARNKCRYEKTYMDKTATIGDLADEVIRFGRYSESFPILFGCGHDNLGIFTTNPSGIAGLAQGSLSLISQLGGIIGHKFSYCLVPFHNTYSNSKLTFGNNLNISGPGLVSTPLLTFSSSLYYLTLEAVSIGKDKVEPVHKKGNMIVDSGTTLTMLESSFYNQVENSVIEAFGDDREPIQNPPAPFKLCYAEGSTDEDFPNITFYFAGSDKGLKFNTFNVVGRYFHNLLCFLMVPTKGISILGNLAQVHFKVEYDLLEEEISFLPADCTKK